MFDKKVEPSAESDIRIPLRVLAMEVLSILLDLSKFDPEAFLKKYPQVATSLILHGDKFEPFLESLPADLILQPGFIKKAVVAFYWNLRGRGIVVIPPSEVALAETPQVQTDQAKTDEPDEKLDKTDKPLIARRKKDSTHLTPSQMRDKFQSGFQSKELAKKKLSDLFNQAGTYPALVQLLNKKYGFNLDRFHVMRWLAKWGIAGKRGGIGKTVRRESVSRQNTQGGKMTVPKAIKKFVSNFSKLKEAKQAFESLYQKAGTYQKLAKVLQAKYGINLNKFQIQRWRSKWGIAGKRGGSGSVQREPVKQQKAAIKGNRSGKPYVETFTSNFGSESEAKEAFANMVKEEGSDRAMAERLKHENDLEVSTWQVMNWRKAWHIPSVGKKGKRIKHHKVSGGETSDVADKGQQEQSDGGKWGLNAEQTEKLMALTKEKGYTDPLKLFEEMENENPDGIPSVAKLLHSEGILASAEPLNYLSLAEAIKNA